MELGTRYGAAWGEHAERVAQRQQVVLAYMAGASAFFGYYFSASPHNPFVLIWGVTIFTAVCSMLFWSHTRVLQFLTFFMARCEKESSASITAQGGVFYFLDPSASLGALVRIDPFHAQQRNLQRYIFSCLGAAGVIGAITTANVTADRVLMPVVVSGYVCLVMAATFLIVPFFRAHRDLTDFERETVLRITAQPGSSLRTTRESSIGSRPL